MCFYRFWSLGLGIVFLCCALYRTKQSHTHTRCVNGVLSNVKCTTDDIFFRYWLCSLIIFLFINTKIEWVFTREGTRTLIHTWTKQNNKFQFYHNFFSFFRQIRKWKLDHKYLLLKWKTARNQINKKFHGLFFETFFFRFQLIFGLWKFGCTVIVFSCLIE